MFTLILMSAQTALTPYAIDQANTCKGIGGYHYVVESDECSTKIPKYTSLRGRQISDFAVQQSLEIQRIFGLGNATCQTEDECASRE